MKTIYYLNNKKISRKALKEKIGDERVKAMTAEAKDSFRADPLVLQSFFLGSLGMLVIEFE